MESQMPSPSKAGPQHNPNTKRKVVNNFPMYIVPRNVIDAEHRGFFYTAAALGVSSIQSALSAVDSLAFCQA